MNQRIGDPYHENFIQLVDRMRTAQKQYFATRSQVALRGSKALEQQVDQFISKHNQPELFDNE